MIGIYQLFCKNLTKTALLLAIVGLCRLGAAQEVSYALLRPVAMAQPEAEPAPLMKTTQPAPLPKPAAPHRFWDRENNALFGANAAFSTADFFVTQSNLNHGGQELNPITRVFSGSTAGLAANFAGETAGVIGLSYFLHKTGHHNLERTLSMLNIGNSAAAVAFGLAHR